MIIRRGAVHLLHIPKTGGTSLRWALEGKVQKHGHTVRLVDVPDPAIVFVRDPVARFISVYDHERVHNSGHYILKRTADELALDMASQDHWLLRPMTWWLDGVHGRDVFIGHTETLADDLARLCHRFGFTGCHLPTEARRRNAATIPKSSLSADAEAALREWYADDYALLAALTQ